MTEAPRLHLTLLVNIIIIIIIDPITHGVPTGTIAPHMGGDGKSIRAGFQKPGLPPAGAAPSGD